MVTWSLANLPCPSVPMDPNLFTSHGALRRAGAGKSDLRREAGLERTSHLPKVTKGEGQQGTYPDSSGLVKEIGGWSPARAHLIMSGLG